MSYDADPNQPLSQQAGLTIEKLRRAKALLHTGAKSPFAGKQKKRSQNSFQNRGSQTLEQLKRQEEQALADLVRLKNRKVPVPDDDPRVMAANDFLKKLYDWRRNLSTHPFRDARPHKKQREAAYVAAPDPYEKEEPNDGIRVHEQAEGQAERPPSAD